MGRPPQPHHETATHGELTPEGTPARLRFVPHGFAALVELQRELADEELELRLPGGEDDFTETLFELSAAVAHVLGRHQDHYASEAFFASAATTLSLQRHGRRLAYRSAPGLSASGVVALTVREDPSGELEAGLALQSTAVGGDKPQHYETLAARVVDARWNAISPSESTQPIAYASASVVRVFGVDLGLEVGEPVAVAGPNSSLAPHPYRVLSIVEQASEGLTIVELDGVLPASFDASTWTLRAKPKHTRRLFGWDANAESFPSAALRTVSVDPDIESEEFPDCEWALDYADGGAGSDLDLFLAAPIVGSLAGPILAMSSGQLSGWAVVDQRDVSVVFRALHEATVTLLDDENLPYQQAYPVTHSIAASSTAIKLADDLGDVHPRSEFDPRTQLLTDFELALEFVALEPNTETIVVGDTLELDDSYALTPGMLIVLLRPSDGDASVAELDRVDQVDGKTHIRFSSTGSSTSGASEWTLGDLQILANVVEVSHGKTRVEVLGDSDGISPHQRFTLSKAYVTQLLLGDGADGATPALIVRVANVEWTRVDDFGDSGPDDRHYRVELDEAQQLSVIFGDGRKGAV
ncbi:MAG TPA: hypothetical protein VM869_00625, partial [Enhygromyxa sp.]|nr:hypothetical protein [Enhygromyxa sp.]